MSTASAVPTDTPAEQQDLVAHLADRVRSLLAGDAEECMVIEQRFPSKVLQLGVLPALPTPDPGTPDTPEELARKLGRAPSGMSLDFLLDPPAGDAPATLDLTAACSVYLQRYPTCDEQDKYHSGDQGPAEDADSDEDVEDNGDGGSGGGGSGGPRNMRLFNIFERFDMQSDRLIVQLTGTNGEDELPLTDALLDAVGAHSGQRYRDALTDRATVYPFWGARGQVLPVTALDGDQAHFDTAVRDAEGGSRTERLAPQDVVIQYSWQPDESGALRVKVTLSNRSPEPRRERPRRRREGEEPQRRPLNRDLELFNSRLRAYSVDSAFRETRFLQSPSDFRYFDSRSVWCTGINCVGRRLDATEDAEQPLATETWPMYVQKRMEPRTHSREGGPADLVLTFSELADADTMMPALARVREAMRNQLVEWQTRVDAWPDAQTMFAAQDALKNFQGDIDGFERGMDLLRADKRLCGAYLAANEVFARSGAQRGISSWRLFQVVYQVCQLAALHAREADLEARPDLQCELDTVDVLWFPTGGGKTEAYLGLIVVALFYDRLRGKERGVTAMLRFPLRMLSVQQLQRILAVVWVAERLRGEYEQAGGVTVDEETFTLDGDPFALGYWVGKGNSPNSLTRRSNSEPKEHINWWAAQSDDDLDDLRIVTGCPDPACAGRVKLVPDTAAVRLRHVCDDCGGELPLYISDEEVYRYLPAVLVSTVDKLAHIARADQFVGVFAGPAYRCPDHGYFTWHEASGQYDPAGGAPTQDDRCLARELCAHDKADYEVVGATHDPSPALMVQDELHLLQEELGTFNAHYETLTALLQKRLGSGKPSKLLAATATIEAFEAQVAQLYARRARVFPSAGLDLGETFYVTTDRDSARRVYVGALPYRTDVTEFGGVAQVFLHAEVLRMHADPAYGLDVLGLTGERDEAWLKRLLADYQLTLGYVNRKSDADRIAYQLTRAFARGELPEEVISRVLIGGNSSLADIAETLNRIQDQTGSEPDWSKWLRALVATSVISHGVDLDALNLMVINNMTPDVASYVQSSSRSGRTHVGLVIVSFDRRSPRQRSFFQYFLKYHEFVDRLIAPVPVNRFARFAVTRTVPGIISALLLHVFGYERLRDTGFNAQRTTPKSLRVGNQGRRWFTDANPPADKPAAIQELVVDALGGSAKVTAPDGVGGLKEVRVFEHRMSNALESEAVDEVDKQLGRLRDPGATGSTPERMRPRPLTSFRDVDEPLTFVPTNRSAPVQGSLVRAGGGTGS